MKHIAYTLGLAGMAALIGCQTEPPPPINMPQGPLLETVYQAPDGTIYEKDEYEKLMKSRGLSDAESDEQIPDKKRPTNKTTGKAAAKKTPKTTPKTAAKKKGSKKTPAVDLGDEAAESEAKSEAESEKVEKPEPMEAAEPKPAPTITSKSDASRVERQLEADPSDVASRIALLEYYAKNPTASGSRQHRREHALWLIEFNPKYAIEDMSIVRLDPSRDATAYEEAKVLWSRHISAFPKDAQILSNAADFFTLPDPRKSIELSKQLEKLKPKDWTINRRMGRLYMLDASGLTWSALTREQQKAALRGLEQFERGLMKIDNDADCINLLPDTAEAAFRAGDLDKAHEYANVLLENEGLYFDSSLAHHTGHSILGRIAMREGKTDKARGHLLESGQVSTSTTLENFGPGMSLAADLINAGETDVVIQYFDQCWGFWKSGREKLQGWRRTVEKGGMPDFGPNIMH